MVNYQDFRTIGFSVEKTIQDYGEKYGFKEKSLGFSWMILDTIFHLQEDEIDEALVDTSYLKKRSRDSKDDCGIDALIINEEEKSVKLLNFKYCEEIKNADNHFPSGELTKTLNFLYNLLNRSTETLEINQSLKDKCEEIFSFQDQGVRFKFELYFVRNGFQGFQEAQEKNFRENLKNMGIYDDVAIKLLLVKDIVHEIINDRSEINARVKSISKNFFEKSEGGNRALVFEIYAKDAIRIVSDDEVLRENVGAEVIDIRNAKIDERAFDDNVRIYLRQATSINKEIKNTAIDVDESANFFFYNNGLTITCDSIDYQGQKDVLITLKNIQVVNGGQTIHALKEAWKESENVENISLLCRIYQTNKADLKAKIARFTNSQNPVKSRDIRSLDDIQIKLEKQFEAEGYFYERKKNQYKEKVKDKRLDSEKIGQILYAYLGEPAKAKNKKSLIFGSEYEKIFNDHTDAKDILKKYKLYLLVEKKKLELEKELPFLKYATYYILYCYALLEKQEKNYVDREEEFYQQICERLKTIVEEQNLPLSLLFKGEILKKYLSTFGF
ncbi:hypothetical protein BBW65_07145 [Helicobacter enhydrae]|uniref:Abortive phage infection protein C-terminal domain-containing protein n=1 Tax=Helicobacter enhydrae TaxID=222136 RepID=A0A1B1U722_9HELI|nr:AIPR family protein [Helicobacter enhydrae]ANV98583.1 hypothetical protein BBW65_07145 [Helicobacter enhydrae]